MKDHVTLSLLAMCVAGLVSASPALAATDYFTLTDNTTSVIYSFSLQSNPVPTNVYTDDFEIDPVSYAVNNTQQNPGFVAFYDMTDSGGLVLADSTETVIFGTSGDPVYTGTLSDPTFVLGSYPELGGPGAGDITTDDVTLVISDTPTAATPEPNSLLLLGTGALSAAGVLRRRRSL